LLFMRLCASGCVPVVSTSSWPSTKKKASCGFRLCFHSCMLWLWLCRCPWLMRCINRVTTRAYNGTCQTPLMHIGMCV
ncbi:hypothetical protein B0H65DRAFT_472188, partial [Neurospora tetraspora]